MSGIYFEIPYILSRNLTNQEIRQIQKSGKSRNSANPEILQV